MLYLMSAEQFSVGSHRFAINLSHIPLPFYSLNLVMMQAVVRQSALSKIATSCILKSNTVNPQVMFRSLSAHVFGAVYDPC